MTIFSYTSDLSNLAMNKPNSKPGLSQHAKAGVFSQFVKCGKTGCPKRITHKKFQTVQCSFGATLSCCSYWWLYKYAILDIIGIDQLEFAQLLVRTADDIACGNGFVTRTQNVVFFLWILQFWFLVIYLLSGIRKYGWQRCDTAKSYSSWVLWASDVGVLFTIRRSYSSEIET